MNVLLIVQVLNESFNSFPEGLGVFSDCISFIREIDGRNLAVQASMWIRKYGGPP